MDVVNPRMMGSPPIFSTTGPSTATVAALLKIFVNIFLTDYVEYY